MVKANLPVGEKAPAVATVVVVLPHPFGKKRLLKPKVSQPPQKKTKKNTTLPPKKLGTGTQASRSKKTPLPTRARQTLWRHTGTVEPLSQSVNECVVCKINHDMPSEWKVWELSHWTKSCQVSSAPRGVKSCCHSDALALCFHLPGKTCGHSKMMHRKVWPSRHFGQEMSQPCNPPIGDRQRTGSRL
jgi:hypothetical protein